MPSLRLAILDGSFHRVVCPNCGRSSNAESTFFYIDLDRKALFLVFPRRKRRAYRAHGEILRLAADLFPPSLLDRSETKLRLVYGLDELREKLVAQDANYDDGALEYLKTRLLAAHPVLTQTNRVQLILHSQSRAYAQFVAYFHNEDQLYQLGLTRSLADQEIAANTEWLRRGIEKAAPGRSPFPEGTQLDAFWVNFRNWTSRYDALQVLHSLAADIHAGHTPSLNSPDFKQLLAKLPQGVNLSTEAKVDLGTLFDYSRAQHNESVERQLLGVRFGKKVVNEWSGNTDETALPVLWKVLRSLPPSDVEGNASFKTIKLDDVNGGLYNDDGTIEIGSDELSDLVEFAETMRHEVGHAVNEQFRAVVDPWLEQTFGWKMYPVYGAGNDEWTHAIEQWVKAMGGWGQGSDQEHQQIAQFLQDCLVQTSEIASHGGAWDPAVSPPFPTGHAWHSEACRPAEAYRRSGGGTWYSSCADWLRNGDKKFSVNFYYGNLMEVNASAIDDYVLKEKRADHYGAMSMPEFFAELYALYFDPPEDPANIIAPAALTWLRENIGPMTQNNPAIPVAAPKPDSSSGFAVSMSDAPALASQELSPSALKEMPLRKPRGRRPT